MHNGKAQNFFASPHILLDFESADAEMNGKHSYDIRLQRAVAKCTDFTLSVYLKERVHLEDLNIDVRK